MNSQNNQLLTEEFRQNRLLRESKKNQQVKRWAPVLKKCKEITPQKYGLMAALLENQFNHWDPNLANGTYLFWLCWTQYHYGRNYSTHQYCFLF